MITLNKNKINNKNGVEAMKFSRRAKALYPTFERTYRISKSTGSIYVKFNINDVSDTVRFSDHATSRDVKWFTNHKKAIKWLKGFLKQHENTEDIQNETYSRRYRNTKRR